MAQAIFGQIVRSSPKWIHRAYKSSHKFGYCTRNVLPGKKASLVIFDKDGTLICFGAGWTEWTHSAVKSFSAALNNPHIDDDLYELIGYDPKNNKWIEGLFCETDEIIVKGLKDFLMKHGMDEAQAKVLAQQNYIVNTHDGPGVNIPIDNPKQILTTLKRYGVKTAICTSDSRPGMEYMMDDLQLHGLVDTSLCGSDSEMLPKPNPHNVHVICDRLNVNVDESVMVGDTNYDVHMGVAAGCKLTVGVSSGCQTAENLHKADVILPSIQKVLDLVLPENYIMSP